MAKAGTQNVRDLWAKAADLDGAYGDQCGQKSRPGNRESRQTGQAEAADTPRQAQTRTHAPGACEPAQILAGTMMIMAFVQMLDQPVRPL